MRLFHSCSLSRLRISFPSRDKPSRLVPVTNIPALESPTVKLGPSVSSLSQPSELTSSHCRAVSPSWFCLFNSPSTGSEDFAPNLQVSTLDAGSTLSTSYYQSCDTCSQLSSKHTDCSSVYHGMLTRDLTLPHFKLQLDNKLLEHSLCCAVHPASFGSSRALITESRQSCPFISTSLSGPGRSGCWAHPY